MPGPLGRSGPFAARRGVHRVPGNAGFGGAGRFALRMAIKKGEGCLEQIVVRIRQVGTGRGAVAVHPWAHHQLATPDTLCFQLSGNGGIEPTAQLQHFDAGTAHGIPSSHRGVVKCGAIARVSIVSVARHIQPVLAEHRRTAAMFFGGGGKQGTVIAIDGPGRAWRRVAGSRACAAFAAFAGIGAGRGRYHRHAVDRYRIVEQHRAGTGRCDRDEAIRRKCRDEILPRALIGAAERHGLAGTEGLPCRPVNHGLGILCIELIDEAGLRAERRARSPPVLRDPDISFRDITLHRGDIVGREIRPVLRDDYREGLRRRYPSRRWTENADCEPRPVEALDIARCFVHRLIRGNRHLRHLDGRNRRACSRHERKHGGGTDISLHSSLHECSARYAQFFMQALTSRLGRRRDCHRVDDRASLRHEQDRRPETR